MAEAPHGEEQGDGEDLDLDISWPALPDDADAIWPKERRRPKRPSLRRHRSAAAPPTEDLKPDPDASPPVEEPAGDATSMLPVTEAEATPASTETEPKATPATPEAAAEEPPDEGTTRKRRSSRAERKATKATAPIEPDPSAPEPPASDEAPSDEQPAPSPPPTPRRRPAASAPAAGGEAATVDLARLRALQDEATVEILDAVNSVDQTLRRVEQVSSALAAEMAEIAQVICDESERHATTTREEIRSELRQLGSDVETLGETIADAIAGVRSDGSTAGGGAAGKRLEQLAESTERVEALVEDLLVSAEERPADVTEMTARTLERLGVTVSARVEAATRTAVDAIDEAVDKALARAAQQFKELAPPMADRSTTSALVRLEERVAELSRLREADEAAVRGTLESLSATVDRLATAHAEDLERILDTVEGTRAGNDDADELAKAVASLAAVAELPAATEELVAAVADQTEAMTTQMEAVRRRLALRARTTLDRATLEQLAELVADRLRDGPSEDEPS